MSGLSLFNPSIILIILIWSISPQLDYELLTWSMVGAQGTLAEGGDVGSWSQVLNLASLSLFSGTQLPS